MAGAPNAGAAQYAETAADQARDDTHNKAPPRKRRRIVISCTECHRRKQRCDRQLPCANCESRQKASSCRYETGAPASKTRAKSSNDGSPGVDDSIPMKAADFGYSHTGASTLGFLRKIEGASDGEPISSLATEPGFRDHSGIRERYKSLIRQLPARTYLEKLVAIYFRDFNWQYVGLDEEVMQEQMAEWNNLPFNLLSSQGPQALSPDLRAFPAVLFQVCATALLTLPAGPDEFYDALKFAGNMTFDDLALEYSESAVSLLSLLGKRQMTLTTVTAGWLRAAFLKYTGMVTEAWHQVGVTIRDAQEIGLHRDSSDPQPSTNDSTETALELMWEAQRRRRVWMILLAWDLHTGAVLGRPTSVDHRLLSRSLPIDAASPKDRRKTPIIPRGEDDPPTPMTRSLWGFECMKPLREILDLEKEGPFPKDFSKVEKVHQELVSLTERIPGFFRLRNPDTRFDHLPECWWLKYARPVLPQIISFNFMALHRPYIYTRAQSRHEALKACLDMLEAQKLHFASLNPRQYTTFSLFFGTFDAIVMMASIYILFPQEHTEMVSSALQHFQWAVERFETVSDRNRLAKAALGVLAAIHVRFRKAVGGDALMRSPSGGPPTHSSGSTTGSDSRTPGSESLNTSHRTPLVSISAGSTLKTESGAGDTAYGTPGMNAGSSTTGEFGLSRGGGPGPEWALPTGLNLDSIAPLYPMADIAYNDLWTGIGGVNTGMRQLPMGNGAQPNGVGLTSGQTPFQFEGDFGNDSFWSLLNQYTPS